MKKLRVAVSPLSNHIFVGTLLEDGRTWAAGKQDVTLDCLVAAAEHVMRFGKPVEIYREDESIEFRITAEHFPASKEAKVKK